MLKLSVVTPSKKILVDTPVDEIFVPAYRGELNILEGHAALMSTLETGILRYRISGETELHQVAVSWGYLEVSHDRVSVLAETAETAAEVNLDRAQKSKAKAEAALLGADLEQHEFARQTVRLERSIIRIEIATGGNPQTGGKSYH